MKKLWTTVNTILNKTKIKVNNFDININYANNFVSNVGKETLDKILKIPNLKIVYVGKHHVNSVLINSTSTEDIINIINSLILTSLGYDNISTFIRKKLLNILKYLFAAFSILVLILEPFLIGLLKIAHVVPIYKNDNFNNISNYRPISVFPYFQKILEKIMHIRLTKFMCHYNLLTKSQHGFSAPASTTTALIGLDVIRM